MSSVFDTSLHTTGGSTTESSVMNLLSSIESRGLQAGPAATSLLPQFRTSPWQTGKITASNIRMELFTLEVVIDVFFFFKAPFVYLLNSQHPYKVHVQLSSLFQFLLMVLISLNRGKFFNRALSYWRSPIFWNISYSVSPFFLSAPQHLSHS